MQAVHARGCLHNMHRYADAQYACAPCSHEMILQSALNTGMPMIMLPSCARSALELFLSFIRQTTTLTCEALAAQLACGTRYNNKQVLQHWGRQPKHNLRPMRPVRRCRYPDKPVPTQNPPGEMFPRDCPASRELSDLCPVETYALFSYALTCAAPTDLGYSNNIIRGFCLDIPRFEESPD